MITTMSVFFSIDELTLLEEFKSKSGMTYRAMLEKAIPFYLKNNFQYVESEYVFYAKIGQTRKKRKEIRISKEIAENLITYCAAHNYSVSSVAAQSTLAFIKSKINDLD